MTLVELTEENFDETLKNNKMLLVDFWAPWCGPCRVMEPIIQRISEEYPDVAVGKLNVDENAKLQERFRVMSIPTFMLFKDGSDVPAVTHIGATSFENLNEAIFDNAG